MPTEKPNVTKSFIAAKAAAGPLPDWEANAAAMSVQSIDSDLIDPGAEQARRIFEDEPLFELATSFITSGLLQPINVSPVAGDLGRPTGRFSLNAGERRLRAWKMVRRATEEPDFAEQMAERAVKHFGDEENGRHWRALAGDPAAAARFRCIPSVVAAVKPRIGQIIDGLIENLLRVNLAALDEADKMAAAVAPVDQGGEGITTEQLASRLSKDVQYVRRRLQLAAAPTLIRKAMSEGVLCTKRDEAGRPVKRGEGEGAVVAQERRTIEDLSAALELAKIYALLTKGLDAPQQKKARTAAEERFANILDDALSRRWSVRKLEEVRKELAETGGKRAKKTPSAQAEEGEGKKGRPVWTDDEKVISVRRDRLADLSEDDRAQLRNRLQDLLALLA